MTVTIVFTNSITALKSLVTFLLNQSSCFYSNLLINDLSRFNKLKYKKEKKEEKYA